jgi:hypothetical protein
MTTFNMEINIKLFLFGLIYWESQLYLLNCGNVTFIPLENTPAVDSHPSR